MTTPTSRSQKKSQNNVVVAVRVRPINTGEEGRGEREVWQPIDEHTIVATVPVEERRGHNQPKFAYDAVFGPTNTSRDVYERCVKDLVWNTMDGVNGTVFAYGQTGSGKTYTMRGSQSNPGVIPLAIRQVFNLIESTPEREFLLRVSYIEIYNEVINDLLAPANTNLKLREDRTAGFFVEGIKEEVVMSMDHVLSLITTGEVHRHVGSTNFNAESSRSHTIFQLHVESSPRAGAGGVHSSRLNLIDLAGSESSRTEYLTAAGERRREGSYINKSLLTLGTVITKLSEGRGGHVPYRDSKITRLLQSSLSGKSQVCVVATVTPATSHMEETHNTLKFASRAKYVEVKAERTLIQDDKALIKQYQREILELRQQLQQYELNQGMATPPLQTPLRSEVTSPTADGDDTPANWEQDKAQLELRIQRLKRIILHSSGIELRDASGTPMSIPRKPPASVDAFRSHPLAPDDDNVSEASAGLAENSPRSDDTPKVWWIPTPGGGGTIPRMRSLALVMDELAEEATTPMETRKSLRRTMPAGVVARDDATSTESPADEESPTVGSMCRSKTAPRTGVDEETAALMEAEMAELVKEAMEKDTEVKQLAEDFRLSQEQHSGAIDELKEQLMKKNKQMSQLERKMVSLVNQGSDAAELTKMMDRMRKEFGERNFELQVVRADNQVLQDTVLQLKRENATLTENLSKGWGSSVGARGAKAKQSLTTEGAIDNYKVALKELQGAEELGASMDMRQLSTLEEMHLQALVRLRTAKEKLRTRRQTEGARHRENSALVRSNLLSANHLSPKTL